MPDVLPSFSSEYFSCRHIILYQDISAAAKAQVTKLLKRVKELTGMPNPAIIQIDTLYF
jgi:hypothetical protein